MEFLYPTFSSTTHRIVNNKGISIQYPNIKGYQNATDIDIDLKNSPEVCVIRENVGYNALWSFVVLNDPKLQISENYNKQFYILNSNLENIGGKQTYKADTSQFNQIDETYSDINPYLKEVFVPYIDRKNGFYSVRISVDYEKILDMKLFNKVLEEVYLEGINVLLASRGILSDNATIKSLRDKYYTFAYIHKDFDITVRRICEPLTFTVSIPLNFFNSSDIAEASITQPIASRTTKFIKFTNLDLVDKIDNIISILQNRIEELNKALFPNKILENFVIDFELNSLRGFASSADELFKVAGYPINPNDDITYYELGLDDNLELLSVSVKHFKDGKQISVYLSQQFISQARLKAEFNNKRIFNYFLNLDNMYNELLSENVIEYYKKYVKYPDISLIDEEYTINGIDISPEQIKEFRLNFSKNSEACYNFSDAQKLLDKSLESTILFDPLYNLFIPNDPKKYVNIPSIKEQISNNLKELNSKKENITIDKIGVGPIQFTVGNSTPSGSITPAPYSDYSSTSNAFAYILKRLDIQEILFTRILCLLKGSNPNAQEIASIISTIPQAILNYIAYIQTIQELKGAAFYRALEQGISLDFQLFCGDELTYFLKGLTKFLSTLNIGINATLTFASEVQASAVSNPHPYKSYNPYQAIIDSVSKTIYIAVNNFLFDIANDILQASCDDPLYEKSPDNFADPFNTHYPISNIGGTLPQNANQPTVNNMVDKLRQNRKKAFKQTLPDIIKDLQYGVDLEYTVDLLGLLINDIKCILTPSESINLLKGSPTDEVVVIIKNIIRNKYSKDPNNLSYLLNDDKLKLLFTNLGLTVDPDVLETEVEVAKIIKSTVCTPEQYQIRCELFKNKLPSELGILQQDTKNRSQKIRNLIDKINSGEKIYTISALCPDIEDDSILGLKKDLAKQYLDSIRSIFSPVLNNFTSEASTLSGKFTEQRQQYRTKDNAVYDSYSYNTFYSNLAKNMNELQCTKEIETIDNTSKLKYIIPYTIKNETQIDPKEIENLFLKSSMSKADIGEQCSVSEFEVDPRFLNFIKEGRLLWENRRWNRDWNSLGEELLSQQPELYDYIISKGYVAIISSETNNQYNETRVTQNNTIVQINGEYVIDKTIYSSMVNAESEENIFYRVVFYSPTNKKFVILYETELTTESLKTQEKVKELKTNIRINLGNYTGEVLSNLEFDREDEEIINIPANEFYNKYYPNTKRFYRLKETTNGDNRRYGTYVIDQYFLDIINIESTPLGFDFEERAGIHAPVGYDDQSTVLNTMQSIYVDSYNTISSIQDYQKLYNSLNTFNKYGLFNITVTYDENNNNIVKDVKIPSSNIDKTKEENIQYSTYYKLNQKSLPSEYLSSEYTEYFYNGYFNAVFEMLKNSRFKINLDIGEILFSEDGKTGIVATNEQILNGLLKETKYKLLKNSEYSNIHAINISNINKLDISSDIRYRNCNVFPHYLNLEYFLNFSEEEIVDALCDSNLGDVPKDILMYILSIMTIRSFTTDIALKAMPYMDLLDINDLDALYLDKNIINIFCEQIKQEMNIFSKNKDFNDKNNYYNLFINNLYKIITKEDYKTFKKKLIREDIMFLSDEPETVGSYVFRSMISNEIKRFIKFCIQNQIIIPRQTSFYNESDTFRDAIKANFSAKSTSMIHDTGFWTFEDNLKKIDYKFNLFVDNLSVLDYRQESYSILMYMIMSNTVDYNKRAIFNSTKAALAEIFFSNVVSLESNSNDTYNERNQEDVVKFINDLAYSSNPAALVYLNPDYSKHISFFLQALQQQTKSILLSNAVQTEPSMFVTRTINYSLSTASSMAWSLVDQEERNRIMIESSVNNPAASLLYNRLNKGMGPLPQALLWPLGALLTGNWIAPFSWGYLTLDTIDEGIWLSKALQEIEELKKYALDGQDPCENTGLNTKLTCVDNKDKLIKEIDQYEE